MNSLITAAQTPAVRVLLFGPVRNILAGAGIAYAIEKEKYWHLPITFFVPSIYAGYHTYKNRRDVVKFFVGDSDSTTYTHSQ